MLGGNGSMDRIQLAGFRSSVNHPSSLLAYFLIKMLVDLPAAASVDWFKVGSHLTSLLALMIKIWQVIALQQAERLHPCLFVRLALHTDWNFQNTANYNHI
jgi:hypothetical protein